jgi:hypothetical protein
MIETGQPQPNWLNNALNYYTDAEPMAFYVNTEAGLVDLALPWWFQYRIEDLTFATDAINARYNTALSQVPNNAPNIRRYVSLMDLDNNGSDGRRSAITSPSRRRLSCPAQRWSSVPISAPDPTTEAPFATSACRRRTQRLV